jgi:Kef-type K+ transport system membrane component KefB
MVVIQTLTGVLLGPSLLGAAFPTYYAAVFNPDVIACLNGLAWWAVMIFVWLTGIELDLKQVWADRRETAVTAGLALGAPMLLGAVAALLVLCFADWVGPKGAPWQMVLGIGMACAVTALPILAALIEELDWLGTPMGGRLLRYASADDILLWIVLALVLLEPASSLRQVGFIAAFAVSSVGFRKLTPRLPQQDRWPIAIVWLVLCALGADWAGLHFIVGGFLAGVVVDAQWLGAKRIADMRLLMLSTLMPVYFLSTGLRTRWGISGAEVLLGAGLFLAAAIGGKLLGVHLAGRLLRWDPGETSIIGWMLQTKGLVMIVFVNVLLDRGIITNEAFTALVLVATASTALAYPVVRWKLARAAALKSPERQPMLGPLPEG